MSQSLGSTGAAHLPRRAFLTLGSASLITLGLAACSPPGASRTASSGPATPVSTAIPSGAVTIQIMASTSAGDAVKKLGQAFTKQHPNVTFDVIADADNNLATNLSRILSRKNPPQLCFVPTVAAPAHDGLLASLDPYAKAYGWDSWSQPLLDFDRVAADGKRGSGSLYAVGIGYNVTGIFYNKKIADKLGVSMPPKSFADFDAACKAAAKAGVLGLSVGAKDAGTPFLLQEVQNSYGGAEQINEWVYLDKGATFDQPGMVKAAAKLQEWKREGVISKDAVSVDYPTMMGDFQAGKSLFVATGDWEAQRLVAAMGDNVGFFLMPNVDPGSKQYAVAFPTNYAIPAGAAHKDVTANFLNWIHTDETARQMVVDVIGCSPGGPTDLPVPPSKTPLVQETTGAFKQVLSGGGSVDAMVNVNQGFSLSTFNPLMQALMLGTKSPQQFVDAVQSAYESDLVKQ